MTKTKSLFASKINILGLLTVLAGLASYNDIIPPEWSKYALAISGAAAIVLRTFFTGTNLTPPKRSKARARGTAALMIGLLVAASFTGCASAPAAGPVTTPGEPAQVKPFSRTAIEFGRAAGRIGLTLALTNAGMPAADVQILMTSLRTVVDQLLDGRDIRATLSDPLLWAAFKTLLVERVATVLVQAANVGDAPVFDQALAEAFVSDAIDAAAAVLRR